MTPNWVLPALGAALVVGSLGGLMTFLHAWGRKRQVHPEILRKLLHMGMGLVALPFPWLFPGPLPVVALGIAVTLGLLVLRTSPGLRSEVGGVIHGVARDTYGEIYYAVSVTLVFLLSRGDPVLFCIPVLVLALSDALAALVGLRYGQLHFTTSDGQKSAEGSLVFFITAFLSVHVPLLLFTDVGRAQSLLIGLVMGLIAMLLEATAWRGLDNLFVPLGGYAILRSCLDMGTADLAARLVVTLVLVAFAFFWQRRSTLIDEALFAAALAGYVIWTVGGWRWMIAPLIFFLGYNRMSPGRRANVQRVHDARGVLAVAAPGLLWLFLAAGQKHPVWLLPYGIAFAGNLAIAGAAQWRFDDPAFPTARLLIGSAGKAWLLQVLPLGMFLGLRGGPLLLAALPAVLLAVGLFYRLQPGMDDCPPDDARWVRQAAIVGAVSLLGAIPVAWVLP